MVTFNHAALFIGAPGADGTPLEIAEASVSFFAHRMPTFFCYSLFTHQGKDAENTTGGDLWEFDHLLKRKGVRTMAVTAATDHDHRNCALAWIRAMEPEVNRLWIVDTDEFYGDEDFRALESIVDTDAWSAWFISRIAYWKGLNWRIDPVEPVNTLLAINPKKIPCFYYSRIPHFQPDVTYGVINGIF